MVFMKLRGQFSIELFLVLSLFAITLFWLNNYYQQLSASDLLYAQQNSLAHQMAFLASETFASGETIVFAMPCFSLKGENVPFWVTAQSNALVVRSVVPAVDKVIPVPFNAKMWGVSAVLRFDCAGGNAGSIRFKRESSWVLICKYGEGGCA